MFNIDWAMGTPLAEIIPPPTKNRLTVLIDAIDGVKIV
jgi:hypothetical protein